MIDFIEGQVTWKQTYWTESRRFMTNSRHDNQTNGTTTQYNPPYLPDTTNWTSQHTRQSITPLVIPINAEMDNLTTGQLNNSTHIHNGMQHN